MDVDSLPVRVGLTVTGIGALYLLYCLYKENQKFKSIHHRRKIRQLKDKHIMESAGVQVLGPIDDPKEQQAFILREIQKAETLMTEGRYERAVVHFANAIAVCADPHRLVLALKESLPPVAFDLLLKVLADSYGKKFSRSKKNSPRTSVCYKNPDF